MSSVISENSILSFATRYLSEDIASKVNRLVKRCVSTMIQIGIFSKVNPDATEYIMSKEIKILGDIPDDEVDFISGIAHKAITEIQLFVPDSELSNFDKKEPTPPGLSIQVPEVPSVTIEQTPVIKSPVSDGGWTEIKSRVVKPKVEKVEKPSYSKVLLESKPSETSVFVPSDEFSDEKEKTVYSKEKTYNFPYVSSSGFVDPLVVDSKLYDVGYTTFFTTNGVTEDELNAYLFRNFPRTEYYTSYKPVEGSDDFRVRITFNGITESSKMENFIDSKLKDRDFIDVFTTYGADDFTEYISPFHSDEKKKYFMTMKEIDDRITSFRFFKLSSKEFSFPTKKKLLEGFKENKYQGDIPVTFVNNIPENVYSTLKNNTIHGFKFILSKAQPSDSSLKNIIVFSRNK